MKLPTGTPGGWTLSALLTMSGGAVLVSHAQLAAIAGNRSAYLLGTILLLLIAGLIIVVWPRHAEPLDSGRPRLWVAVLTVAAGFAVLWWVAGQLLATVFAGAINSSRGDMLVIIEHAIKRLLEGGNPYTVHHVPWDAPLAYGPLLWLPDLISYLLGFDFRIYTLVAVR